MARLLRVLPVLLSLCIVESTALAAEPSAADRFAAAKQALQQKRYDDAIGLFRALHKGAGAGPDMWFARLGLALAYQLKGDAEPAIHHFRSFLKASEADPRAGKGTWPAKRAEARRTIDELVGTLLQTHAELHVTSSPASATVRIEGVALPRPDAGTPRHLYIKPGRHRVKVRKDGFKTEELNIELEEGDRRTVHLSLARVTVDKSPQKVPDKPMVTPPPPAEPQSPALTITGWTLAGVGVATWIAGGVVTGMMAADYHRAKTLTFEQLDAFNRLNTSVQNRVPTITALYAIGGVMVAAGATLLIVDALSGSDGEKASVRVAPTTSGVVVGGHF